MLRRGGSAEPRGWFRMRGGIHGHAAFEHRYGRAARFAIHIELGTHGAHRRLAARDDEGTILVLRDLEQRLAFQ